MLKSGIAPLCQWFYVTAFITSVLSRIVGSHDSDSLLGARMLIEPTCPEWPLHRKEGQKEALGRPSQQNSVLFSCT